MVNIPMKTEQPLTRETVLSLNQRKVQRVHNGSSVCNLNTNTGLDHNQAQRHGGGTLNTPPRIQPAVTPPAPAAAHTRPKLNAPALHNEVRKGQKIHLKAGGNPGKLCVSMGWDVLNSQCDVDVSAFLLRNGRVLGDEWFVFYGQQASPDGSTVFSAQSPIDRECISIDFSRLNSSVDRIVFVLSINDAADKRLNFSMIRDAYIRVVDSELRQELVSFRIDEYYQSVVSMTIGEIYLHNGVWKFSAVGNGVGRDLADLCRQYGVRVE